MIEMNGFTAEPEELRQAELAGVERVFSSGRFILGKELERFEHAWADFCQTEFCVGVGNGMEALELGLRALDIGPGDEVITTPMTAIATVLAIIHAGATPVFADIDLANALLDISSVKRCVSSRTKAILLVHLYGQVCDMTSWIEFCRDAKIHLLEDCAQAHGAVFDRRGSGSVGAWGAFSFYPTKNLGAKGDAGAVVTNSKEVATRMKRLRNCGTTDRYTHTDAGLNSRLDEVQAAVLSVRLGWLKRFNARRQEIARRYLAEIKNPRIQLLAPPHHSENHVYHLFVIRCAQRDALLDFLTSKDVAALIHYPIPAHRQACCNGNRHDPSGLPNADLHAQQCVSIPCHPQLTDKNVAQVIDTINAFK
jgi:dTDP-4-amino-4,6-dideoxygalactose transaminase